MDLAELAAVHESRIVGTTGCSSRWSIIRTRPRACQLDHIATWATPSASGFSTTTCLPARKAAQGEARRGRRGGDRHRVDGRVVLHQLDASVTSTCGPATLRRAPGRGRRPRRSQSGGRRSFRTRLGPQYPAPMTATPRRLRHGGFLQSSIDLHVDRGGPGADPSVLGHKQERACVRPSRSPSGGHADDECVVGHVAGDHGAGSKGTSARWVQARGTDGAACVDPGTDGLPSSAPLRRGGGHRTGGVVGERHGRADEDAVADSRLVDERLVLPLPARPERRRGRRRSAAAEDRLGADLRTGADDGLVPDPWAPARRRPRPRRSPTAQSWRATATADSRREGMSCA